MFKCFCGRKKSRLTRVSSLKTTSSHECIQTSKPLDLQLKANKQTYVEDPDLQEKLILIRKQHLRYFKEVLSKQILTIKPDLYSLSPEEFPLYKQENGTYYYFTNTLIV